MSENYIIISSDLQIKDILSTSSEQLVFIIFVVTRDVISDTYSAEVKKIALDYPGALFLEVDKDAAPKYIVECQISKYPSTVLSKNGQNLVEYAGCSVERLKNILERFY